MGERGKDTWSTDSNLMIRWTFGDWAEQPTHPQGISLLRTSIQFAKLLFPNAHFMLCHNTLISSGREIESIAEDLNIRLFDSKSHLPHYLRTESAKNSWWKYAPPRLNANGFEIVLDNDVILWKRPSVIDDWLTAGGLLALGTRRADVRPKLYYGEYGEDVRKVDPYLDLNAGILGWPPDYIPPLQEAKDAAASEFFHTEQGFSALSFALYSGIKHLIPYEEVPLMHVTQPSPDKLIENYSGGHFCECTYGYYTYWVDTYQEVVCSHLNERIKRAS